MMDPVTCPLNPVQFLGRRSQHKSTISPWSILACQLCHLLHLAQQLPHVPPPGDVLGRVAPMLPGVAVALGCEVLGGCSLDPNRSNWVYEGSIAEGGPSEHPLKCQSDCDPSKGIGGAGRRAAAAAADGILGHGAGVGPYAGEQVAARAGEPPGIVPALPGLLEAHVRAHAQGEAISLALDPVSAGATTCRLPGRSRGRGLARP
jgi:hypothetical protein